MDQLVTGFRVLADEVPLIDDLESFLPLHIVRRWMVKGHETGIN